MVVLCSIPARLRYRRFCCRVVVVIALGPSVCRAAVARAVERCDDWLLSLLDRMRQPWAGW